MPTPSGHSRLPEAHVGVHAQLDPRALWTALTTRAIVLVGERIIKQLGPSAAAESRDSLAKNLYARLFDWIVAAINRKISALGGSCPAAGRAELAVLTHGAEVDLLPLCSCAWACAALQVFLGLPPATAEHGCAFVQLLRGPPSAKAAWAGRAGCLPANAPLVEQSIRPGC